MTHVISKVQLKHNKTRTIFCNIGDRLKVVSKIGNQLIVETINNKRFFLTLDDVEPA